jgi:hypothetical protein
MKKLFLAMFPVLLSGAVYAQDRTERMDRHEDADALRAEGREWHSDAHFCPPRLANTIGLAPIQFTENGVAGVSISYEYSIDPDGFVAFYIPAILEFNTSNNNNNNYYGGTNASSNDPMFYLMPGIKIYPTGTYGIAKYAIGPNLVIADGRKTSYYDPYYGGVVYNSTQDHFVLGMMVNQSLNICPTPHLYLGTELGMGFSYLNRIGGINDGTEFLIQFNFKVGYKF